MTGALLALYTMVTNYLHLDRYQLFFQALAKIITPCVFNEFICFFKGKKTLKSDSSSTYASLIGGDESLLSWSLQFINMAFYIDLKGGCP